MPDGHSRYWITATSAIWGIASLALLVVPGAGQLEGRPARAQSVQNGDEFLIVDCLLPGQVRKLGRKLSFLTPRRPVRTTQSDCEIRGGEYVSYDRADYGTALKIWLPLAQEGDPKAQNYVGEIAEKGLGQRADYEMAALWYRRAAEQGYSPAQINFGQLYEKGLGVEKDMASAVMWYRRAAGLDDARFQDVAFGNNAGEIERLQSALSERTEEVNALRAELTGLGQDLARARADRQKVDAAATTERARLEQERQDLARAREALAAERRNLAKASAQAARRDADERQAQSDAAKLTQDKAILAEQAKQLAAREAALARKQQALEEQRRDAGEAQSAERKRQAEELAEQEAALRQQATELASREAALERERLALEERQRHAEAAAAAKLEGRARELAERQRRLDERESLAAQREKELSALNAQIAKLDADIEKRRSEVAALQQSGEGGSGGASGERAGTAPRIEVIEPRLIRSRGETGAPVVFTRAGTAFRTVVGKVFAPLGLYQVLVNERQVEVDGNAMFQTEVPVALGPTQVNIVALDKTGQRADLAFELRPESQTAANAADGKSKPEPTQMPNVSLGRFHALIIGNYNYRHLPKLDTPRADAAALAELLREKYGFETTVLLDATRYDILSALNKLRAALTEDDNLLVYYAGHGELDQVNQRGHWLPIDAEPDSTANWIANTAITDILNAMSVRKVLVIADSCYSGSLTRSMLARLDAGRTAEAQEAWIKLMVTKRSRMAFTSGGLAPVLDGGGGRHSIFAKALLDALRQNSGLIDGETLHRIVAQSVSYAAGSANFEQLPQYAPIQYAGHEAGDFFFLSPI